MISSVGNATAFGDHLGYQGPAKGQAAQSRESGNRAGAPSPPPSAGGDQPLGEAETRQVRQLKKRDQEVRAHESAHLAAGADLVQGGASFSFQRGADGRMYAVGGEVKIDTSAEQDPDDTIRKMQQVKRAALAPAQPSGTDRAVAAQAGQIEAQARLEKSAQGEEDANLPVISSRRPYSAEAVGQALDLSV